MAFTMELQKKRGRFMAAEPTKVFMACDIKNGFGAARRRDATEGAKRWCPVLGTVFANLRAGQQGVQPTAWANTPKGSRPITVRDGLLQCACEAPVAFALALRVGMTDFEEEMRNKGSGARPSWTAGRMLTTAELAPLVMAKLRETLERHGLELRKDKCTAYCPTPERVEGIREEMTQFLKWTPEGFMILETASDENIGRKLRQKPVNVTSPRAADSETRECCLTESDRCAQLTLCSCLEAGDHCFEQCVFF